MSDHGLQPYEVRSQSIRLPAERRPGSLENTTKQRCCHFVVCLHWPFLRTCSWFGIRRLVNRLDFIYLKRITWIYKKTIPLLACSLFINLAFFRPTVDRSDSVPPWGLWNLGYLVTWYPFKLALTVSRRLDSLSNRSRTWSASVKFHYFIVSRIEGNLVRRYFTFGSSASSAWNLRSMTTA
jgi:hypothetical protein